MSDALPPPPSAPAPTPSSNTAALAVACATIVILAALAAGGFLLKNELQRLETAKPVAPPEVTKALKDLRTQMDRQRRDNGLQMDRLQQEITALKEQAAATPPAPDMHETLAPMQQQLDAIAAQLQEAPPPAAPTPPAAPQADAPAPSMVLRDYLTLRRRVESGEPYAAELTALIPQLPETQQAAIATLQAHAEHGVALEEGTEEKPLQPWMETLNARMQGLLHIEAKKDVAVSPQQREDVLDALDAIEASLLEQP